MPDCGSQAILCDVPIRFDTYKGCSHACEYCFVNRKFDISQVATAETPKALRGFINGERNANVNWCDWDIPLHWGGMSDPFQPIERRVKRSLECLKVFAETQYPFIVSTKNALIAEEPYLSLLKECNCVVQISALSPKYDRIEKGASTFNERMNAIRKLSPLVKRVNIRCQPYMPQLYDDIMSQMDMYKEIGVYGLIFEGLKAFKKTEGMVAVGNDICYPTRILKRHFLDFREELHKRNLHFYSGENRLRSMSDDLCCCGVDGLGWRVNTANLNHYLFDRQNMQFSEKQKELKTARCFCAINQNTIAVKALQKISFEEAMRKYFAAKKTINIMLPDDKRIK